MKAKILIVLGLVLVFLGFFVRLESNDWAAVNVPERTDPNGAHFNGYQALDSDRQESFIYISKQLDTIGIIFMAIGAFGWIGWPLLRGGDPL